MTPTARFAIVLCALLVPLAAAARPVVSWSEAQYLRIDDRYYSLEAGELTHEQIAGTASFSLTSADVLANCRRVSGLPATASPVALSHANNALAAVPLKLSALLGTGTDVALSIRPIGGAVVIGLDSVDGDVICDNPVARPFLPEDRIFAAAFDD